MTANQSEAVANQIGGRRFVFVDLLLLLVVLIWGTNFSLIKVALAEFPPLIFAVLRFTCAALIMLLLSLLTGHSLRIRREHWLWLAAIGLVGNTMYQLLFMFGANQTTAGNASLLLATPPVWVALIGSLFRTDRITRWGWVGIVLSLIGVVAIITGSDEAVSLPFGGASLAGDLLIFMAALAWASYTILIRPITKYYASITITTISGLIGAIPLLLFASPVLLTTDYTAFSIQGWAALLVSGLLALSVAYFIWGYGIQELGSSRTALYANLTPLVALVVAWLWLGETLTVQQGLGALLALSGVILARRYVKALNR